MAKDTNKQKALTALLNSSTITDAAINCGLSEATLYRYLAEKDFTKEYRSARRQVVENSITQIQRITYKAVETLEKNLSSGNPQVEVSAARIILDNSLKGVELIDVIERLEVLEDEHQKQIEANGKSNNKRRW